MKNTKLTCLSSIAPQVWGKFYVSMGVCYMSADEHTTNIERVLCARIACIGRWSIAPRVRRTKRMVTDHKRWCSALDERAMNDDEQQRTNHFPVRSSCVFHAFTWCDRVFSPQPDTSLHCGVTHYRYAASASRGEPVCVPAFASTHCVYPQRGGRAEFNAL